MSAGDSLWVKAGTYASPDDTDGLLIDKDDIWIRGYDDSTHDLDIGQGVPTVYSQVYTNQNLADMPVISFDNRSGTTGVRIAANGVVFHNFRLRNCRYGVDVINAFDVDLMNLVIYEVGDLTLSSWDGIGINLFTVDGGSIYNCFIADANGTGVRIKENSTNNLVEATTVVATEGPNHGTTDYYFQIANSDDNTVRDCYAECGEAECVGHAFAITASLTNTPAEFASGNVIEFCDSAGVQEAFYLRGGGVSGNYIRDSVSVDNGSIFITSGPSNNSFSRVRIQDNRYGVVFRWNDLSEDPELTIPCSDRNVFDNCIFEDCSVAAIWMKEIHGPTTHIVKETDFVNCTFVNNNEQGVLIDNGRDGTDNLILSCIITGYASYSSGSTHGFNAGYCCFHDNNTQGGFPSGGTHVQGDPDFANIWTNHPVFGPLRNWDLGPSSSCTDKTYGYAGISLSDYDGDIRPTPSANQDWDIGAQEY